LGLPDFKRLAGEVDETIRVLESGTCPDALRDVEKWVCGKLWR